MQVGKFGHGHVAHRWNMRFVVVALRCRADADSPEDLAHDPTALTAVHAMWLSRDRDWPIITRRMHVVRSGTEVKRLR